MSGVERVRSLYESFENGDVPSVFAAFDPKIEWNEAEHVTFWPGGSFTGPDEVMAGVMMRIPEMFGDTFKINIDRIHGSDSTVVMEGRYTGTVQATGRPLSAQVAHIWDLEGEMLVRFQQYTHTWQFAEVTGIAPVTVAV